MRRALASLLLAVPSLAWATPGIINGSDATIEDYPMAGGMMMDADIESPFGNGRNQSYFIILPLSGRLVRFHV